MANLAIVFGALLTALGGLAYAMATTKSVTALIPAFVGLPILLLGVVAMLKPRLLKHTMHLAAALGLLGFLASAGRLIQSLITAESFEADLKFWSILGMAILTGLFVALCVKSFIDARRARRRQRSEPAAG